MAGTVSAIGLSTAFIGTLYSAIASSILVGLASAAGLTFCFAAAREANKLGPEYDTLTIGWVNSLQLSGTFVSPLLFSYSAIEFGYGYAWLCIALLAIFLTLPVLFSSVPRRKNTQQYSRSNNESID
jgi:MFS family permease